MLNMQAFLNDLCTQHALQLDQRGEGWEILLPERTGLSCLLVIGPDALDWGASVGHGTKELWSDWMDYLGYDDKPEAELITEKQRDISICVELWMSASAARIETVKRMWGFRKSSHAEWQHGGIWSEVILCDLN